MLKVRTIAGLLMCAICAAGAVAAPHYEATDASLDQHPLPAWYGDAKLGIFIHYGLYSVPGWAPVSHQNHDFTSQDYIMNNPYAEWYLNSMRIIGSPTWHYQQDHYGANANYYDFVPVFDGQNKKWNPDTWAQVFKDAGARYVVLTTKHHEGYTLWPSKIPNPILPANRQHATRDIVGELTQAVRKQGMRMGLYYSGGYDWTFNAGPISAREDYETVKPQSAAYGKYVDAQYRDLIERYHPAVLWNDIGYPKTGNPRQIQAEYYDAVPDGVVDDRFSIKHADFVSPEYQVMHEIQKKKWEECRGLGQSFGYNRAEGEEETIKPDALVYLLVDIVSKNGNLLLDVGPEADGTIPAIQVDRLKALGAWLKQNGEAIYGTQPWTRAEGKAQDLEVRFTRKGAVLYAVLMGQPHGGSVTIKDLSLPAKTSVSLLGGGEGLSWQKQGADVTVKLPAQLPGKYAYVLKMEGAAD
ncbi:MAG: alpha-L-fucosidase [Acidobacteriaceae bacterium]